MHAIYFNHIYPITLIPPRSTPTSALPNFMSFIHKLLVPLCDTYMHMNVRAST